MNRWLFNPLRLGLEPPRTYEAELDEQDELPIGRQIALYVTVVLGIFASGLLESQQTGKPWHLDWMSFLVALIGVGADVGAT